MTQNADITPTTTLMSPVLGPLRCNGATERLRAHSHQSNDENAPHCNFTKFSLNGEQTEEEREETQKPRDNMAKTACQRTLRVELSCSDSEYVRSEPKSKLSRPYVIGVCGGTASGKTTVCALFEKYLKDERVAFVPSDSFYKCLTAEQKKKANAGEYDFDHPDSIDWVGVKQCVGSLRGGIPTALPTYDFKTHSRTSEFTSLPFADVIILEGILIYSADQELRDMMDLKIFVDCDADVRLARRLTRDITERGRDVESVLTQYMKYVKPSYETFVDPSKRYADIIVPNLGNQINMIGVELLVQQIRHQLECRRILAEKRESSDDGGSDKSKTSTRRQLSKGMAAPEPKENPTKLEQIPVC
eukprot:GEMP01018258.1.p1 GENE.GEMP01018258.1~~GEMP01018258.1.p1  ORF type:complete len:360 (+),score=71.62 GEMP01018258.1:97-1176(+)